MVRKIKGFTITEILIVIGIIIVLASIAYPSYVQHNIRTHRVDMQAEMIRIAGALQRYQMQNSTYLLDDKPITLSDLSIEEVYPNVGTAHYELTLSNVSAGTWTLTARPIESSIQEGNGEIVLTHSGAKCWIESKSCVPSASSTW